MIHNSDKIKQILTSPEGQRFLSQISPIYDEAYIALWIMQANGLQFDDLKNWTDDYWNQIVVQTATWTLPYYEQEYGIPTDPNLSIVQRRNTLFAKIRTKSPINPYRIAAIAQAVCGLPCRVEERTAVNTFDLYVSSLGGIGVDENALKTVVDRSKPGYLVVRIKYEQGVQANFYMAFTSQLGVICTGRQVN